MRIVLYDGLSTTSDAGTAELSPAGHYRLALPGRELARAGHEVQVVKALSFDQRHSRFVGILPTGEVVECVDAILTKNAITQALTLVWDAQNARRSGQLIVHDFDDWTPMLDGGRHPLERVGWIRIHKRADCLFASTPYLADRYSAILDRPAVVLPTCIDLGAWPEATENVSDGPVLGWNGFVHVRRPDLAVLHGWLGPFVEKHDLRIIHAGWVESVDRVSFAEATGVDPERVEVRAAVTADRYPTSGAMDGVDIGLIPLADGSVSTGRTALKGMEFAVRGIPFVASRSESYEALGAGRLAGSSLADQPPSAWLAELERLLDPAERVVAARSDAQAVTWDIRDHWTRWEKALLDLIDRTVARRRQ